MRAKIPYFTEWIKNLENVEEKKSFSTTSGTEVIHEYGKC